MTTIDAAGIDGRRLRRDRNREAVVDALLELYGEGALNPSSDEIADRAGISARSLFRYFDDVDDLMRAAVARQQERIGPLYEHGASPDQPLDDRIERFVASRVRLLEAMGTVGLVARMRAPTEPVIAAELGRIRAVLRAQVDELFANELRDMPRSDASAVAAAVDVLSSWESYDLMRHDQRLSRAAATTAVRTSLGRLLGGR